MHSLRIKRAIIVPTHFFQRLLLISVSLLWLGCGLFAAARLSRYESIPGAAGHPPLHWQKTTPSALAALDPAKPTLLMLVHPQCPCSRASLYELNRLAALCPNRAAVTVLFLRPAGYAQGWVETDLWRQASAIPHVRVQMDDDGRIARHFGALTSGDVVLYAPSGRLLYQGGLTGERGHEGDNAGLSEVAALLLGKPEHDIQQHKIQQEPVYGCPMTAARRVSAAQAISPGGPPWLP